jgi:hypothetical protein
LNQKVFAEEIDRLKGIWPTAFPDEKIKLIWLKVSDLPEHFIKKTSEHFISHNKTAPLPVDFIELARIYRNSNYSQSGFPGRSEIHPSSNSIFSKEDISEMFSMMKKRLKKEITYEELDQYGKMIQQAVGGRK